MKKISNIVTFESDGRDFDDSFENNQNISINPNLNKNINLQFKNQFDIENGRELNENIEKHIALFDNSNNITDLLNLPYLNEKAKLSNQTSNLTLNTKEKINVIKI